jgi:hypothetical protein
MKNQSLSKSLHLLFIAALVATLTIGLAPAQTARADAITTTSDLKVRIISMPKEVKACQTFKVTFSVKNLGPDPASHLYIMVRLPDPFELVVLRGAPESLSVGQTVKFSADIKVVAFVPGEPRKTWLGIDAMSDPYPDISIDPNPDNNPVFKNIRMVSKPRQGCP